MKTLGKLKLNQFSKNEMDQRKLNALKGGCDCGVECSCGCDFYTNFELFEWVGLEVLDKLGTTYVYNY